MGDIETTIFGEYESKLRTLTNWVTGGRKELIAGDVEFIVQRIQSYYGMLPRVHYWDSDREFLYSYSFEQIQASFADERHMFSRFLKAGRISRDEIIKALTHPNEGVRENARSLIEGKIRDNISERFNEFYRQEPVRVRCAFENKVFRTFVSTCGDFLELTERSNGLRWFFSLFIDAISDSDEDADTSVLYLLDEPGVHLHVNAQKELLRFFADLTAERNQIVYSTHSPYMIDNRDILNVRVVQKDENGGSKIFRNAYDPAISSTSKMETLTPLTEALGVNLKFNLGPSPALNVVTEGICEYMYLKAMMDHLEIPNPPQIIPSIGAGNISRVVSILIGWGYDYMVLLDYDKAGYNEYRKLSKYLGDFVSNKVIFVTGGSEADRDNMLQNAVTIESLIYHEDRSKLSVHSVDGKWLAAREFYDRVKAGQLNPSATTVNNFKNLFNALGIETEGKVLWRRR